MTYGKSAYCKSRLARSGTYCFHAFADSEMWRPEIIEEKPKQPAYTALNNDWRKRK